MDNKFVSLAEVLGIAARDANGVQPDPAKPQPKSPPKKLSVKAFCKEILASVEYREHLYRLIVLDQLPPAIEVLLYHYAEGKPLERLEVSEAPAQLDDLSVEQLEDRIRGLHELVKTMRKAERLEAEDDAEEGKVH